MPGLSFVDDASEPGRAGMMPRFSARPRRAIPSAFLCATLALFGTGSLPGSAAAAAKTWTGQGDGITWLNPPNWSGGTIPADSDEVVLDHSGVAAAYDVILPADEGTIAIRRLTLAPGGGTGIRLTLPSDNTANPGLRVGDGVAGT